MVRRIGPRSVPPRGGGPTLERLILDTSILISAERGGAALDAVMADDDDVAIAAITAAELLVGVELTTTRRRDRRREFVEAVLGTIPVEEYDLAVARSHARLLAETHRAGRKRGAHDLIVAATALSTRRVVITTDPSGFANLSGVEVRAVFPR